MTAGVAGRLCRCSAAQGRGRLHVCLRSAHRAVAACATLSLTLLPLGKGQWQGIDQAGRAACHARASLMYCLRSCAHLSCSSLAPAAWCAGAGRPLPATSLFSTTRCEWLSCVCVYAVDVGCAVHSAGTYARTHVCGNACSTCRASQCVMGSAMHPLDAMPACPRVVLTRAWCVYLFPAAWHRPVSGVQWPEADPRGTCTAPHQPPAGPLPPCALTTPQDRVHPRPVFELPAPGRNSNSG